MSRNEAFQSKNESCGQDSPFRHHQQNDWGPSKTQTFVRHSYRFCDREMPQNINCTYRYSIIYIAEIYVTEMC